jgi:hypothetical protein
MQFCRSWIFPPIAILCISTAAIVHAFNVKDQEIVSEERSDVLNGKFEQAVIEDRAYICGTDESSLTAIKAGMRETGLAEDVAVEIVPILPPASSTRCGSPDRN